MKTAWFPRPSFQGHELEAKDLIAKATAFVLDDSWGKGLVHENIPGYTDSKMQIFAVL